MFAAAAILSQVAGFEVLRRSRKRWAFWLAGWSLFVLSFYLFAHAFTTSLSWGWTLSAISVVGYGLILRRFFTAQHIGLDKRKGRFEGTQVREATGVTLAERLICAGPIYLVVALSVAMFFATKMPLQEVTRVVFGALLIPLVWAIGSLHATVDVKRWRVWTVPLGLAALFAGLYFAL